MPGEPNDILMRIFPDRPRDTTADDTPAPGFNTADPAAIIDALTSQYGDPYELIVDLCHDRICHLENGDFGIDPADEPAMEAAEQECERKMAELKRLIEWAWARHKESIERTWEANYPRNVNADGDYIDD